MADVSDDKKSNDGEKFLYAIIEQLDGAIDWQKVADKCGIVSKAAASKRYSRMKIKFEASGGKMDSPTKATTPAADGEEKTPKKKPAKRTPNKKRKVDEAADDVEEPVEEKPVKDEDE
ncbi:hypothetical protein LTR08_004384 [Meristemomyces frigidus]|nr:hypothetical protein LTR08_004384 [Meristemomyces frigidus]